MIEIKKHKVQKSVIKRKLKFEDYKNCSKDQLENKTKLKKIVLEKIIKNL